MITTYAEAVQNGAAWLDSNESGAPKNWRELVDFDSFSIWNGDRCVLGYAFKEAAEEAGVSCGYLYVTYAKDREGGEIGTARFMVEHGFVGGYGADSFEAKQTWQAECSRQLASV